MFAPEPKLRGVWYSRAGKAHPTPPGHRLVREVLFMEKRTRMGEMGTEIHMTFRSITYAQRGAGALLDAGIPCTMARTPQVLAARGCGYSLRLRGDWAMAGQILRQQGIPYSKVYLRDPGGGFREVGP